MQYHENIPRYTINDYKQWQGDWELIRGYPYAMAPSPLKKHQALAQRINYALETEIRKNRDAGCNCEVLYGMDWIVDENTVVRPDIMIVCNNQEADSHIHTPPVLIVEICAPHTRLKDRNTKFKLYQEQGVKY